MENVAIHRLWETLMDDRTTCVCARDTSRCCDFIKKYIYQKLREIKIYNYNELTIRRSILLFNRL